MESKDLERLGRATKLVVMVEVAPLSDTYTQIMLTEEQWRKVSDLLWNMFEDGRDDTTKMVPARAGSDTFSPDLAQWYSPEQINNKRL